MEKVPDWVGLGQSCADDSDAGRRSFAPYSKRLAIRRAVMLGRRETYPNDSLRGWREEIDHI